MARLANIDNIKVEVKAESELYASELEKLNSDPAHYMTPGAKRYFRRVALGYAVLATATVLGIWSVTNHIDARLRSQINTFLVESCKSSIPTLKKFNASIQADIDLQSDSRAINITRGDLARARVNTKIIAAKENAKLHVPTLEECEAKRKSF